MLSGLICAEAYNPVARVQCASAATCTQHKEGSDALQPAAVHAFHLIMYWESEVFAIFF